MTEQKLYKEAILGYSKDNGAQIIETEKRIFRSVVRTITEILPLVYQGFDACHELRPYWLLYAPKQRGHKPRGDSLPWGEVGEKLIEGLFLQSLGSYFEDLEFIGLPYGGDIRFMSQDSLCHFDVKSTGPNDNPNEIVASPNQISGDGAIKEGSYVGNSSVVVHGPRREMVFQPELPPLYMLRKLPRLCVTVFLKVVYAVEEPGIQPLDHVEVVCVPNGLLMFTGPDYHMNNLGRLLTPGKDEVKFKHKRVRVKLIPLAEIATWRCVKLRVGERGEVQHQLRVQPDGGTD
ncbi:BglI family type II restriction endonuclease [bacterium]|nr:BglI family type II restriction endonuclease [bacterium]